MKKKLSIAGLVLILIFGLAGCGSKATGERYDQAELERCADMLIENFSKMSAEEFEQYKSMSDFNMDYAMMMTGFPSKSSNFRTMIDAWNAGQEECGAFLEIGDYTMEVSNSGATLTAPLAAENRDADLVFSFDENSQLESVTVNAHYSTVEILQKAALNTILGMGTVFAVLIFIAYIISLFEKIPALEEKFRKKEPVPQKAAPAQPAPAPAEEVDDGELIAVIAAAIAAAEATSVDGFFVRSVRRRKSNKWS